MIKWAKHIFFLLMLLSAVNVVAQQDFVQYVDPFIGTENSGNVFPGPSLPFGMVRLSPDGKVPNGKSPNNNSGYVSKSPVYGFSHTHVSGTGGGAKYGNILLMPTIGEINLASHESAISNEVAKPGYYAANLDKFNIKVELTATHSVGVHRYTFPKSNQANILIDAASFLIKGSTVQKLVNSGVKVISNSEIEGFGTVSGGWNYIQSAKLNGKNWDKSWFRHGDIINGATLELIMGDKPTTWGSKVSPPSLSDN